MSDRLSSTAASAADVLNRSIQQARAAAWTSLVPWPESLLAEVELRRGDLARAEELAEHAFAMGRQMGDPCWESMGARGLGLVAERRGDIERALPMLEDAPRFCRRLPDAYLWVEAYGRASLLAHRSVVGVPILVGAACGAEDLAKQDPEPLVVYLGVGIVGPDELGATFHRGPPPAGSDHDGDGGIGAQMGELAGATGGDQRDDAVTGHGMGNDTGVDDRGVRGVVGAERDDDTEAVVERHQLFEG